MASVRTDDMVTAVHEAGHVWGYLQQRRPLRYVTLRPRAADAVGRTVPRPKMVNGWDLSVPVAAGPVAEATWSVRRGDEHGLDWQDRFLAALLACGHDDAKKFPPPLLDDRAWIGVLRGQLESSWPRVTELAEMLVDWRTVDGATAARMMVG